MPRILRKIRIVGMDSEKREATDRFNALYFSFFALCFLFFYFNQPHFAGPRIALPQYTLESRIVFTSFILIAFSTFLCLPALGFNPLKKQFAQIPAAKLPKMVSRSLRIFALTIPLLALLQCSFLVLGKSVLAETHPFKTSPSGVWCSSCRQGGDPTLDKITRRFIDPLSYSRIFRLLFGTRPTIELLGRSICNARLHGNDRIEEQFCRERLSLISDLGSNLNKRNAIADLAYNLQRQDKHAESLPFFRAALAIDASLKQNNGLYFLHSHCKLLASAANAEEKAGNSKQAEKLREMVNNSPISHDMASNGKQLEYKFLPVKIVDNLVSQIKDSNKISTGSEALMLAKMPAPGKSKESIYMLEKDRYETLLKLAK